MSMGAPSSSLSPAQDGISHTYVSSFLGRVAFFHILFIRSLCDLSSQMGLNNKVMMFVGYPASSHSHGGMMHSYNFLHPK